MMAVNFALDATASRTSVARIRDLFYSAGKGCD